MNTNAKQKVVKMAIAIATFWLVGHAISNLVFSSLGQTPNDKAWNYVIVLVIFLGLAGGSSGVRSHLQPTLHQMAETLTGATAGAVVGFYYVGMATQKDPRWAIAGAIVGGIILGVLSLKWRTVALRLVINLAGALTAYGFAFLIGATALAWLNVGLTLPGIILGAVFWLYLWFTWNSIQAAVDLVRGIEAESNSVSKTSL